MTSPTEDNDEHFTFNKYFEAGGGVSSTKGQ